MDLHQITENLAGRQDEVHPVVGHRPPVTDVGAMKIGRFTAALVYTGGDLFGQRVQMNTAGMAAAEDVFHQNLGVFQIGLIPAGAAANIWARNVPSTAWLCMVNRHLSADGAIPILTRSVSSSNIFKISL